MQVGRIVAFRDILLPGSVRLELPQGLFIHSTNICYKNLLVLGIKSLATLGIHRNSFLLYPAHTDTNVHINHKRSTASSPLYEVPTLGTLREENPK